MEGIWEGMEGGMLPLLERFEKGSVQKDPST